MTSKECNSSTPTSSLKSLSDPLSLAISSISHFINSKDINSNHILKTVSEYGFEAERHCIKEIIRSLIDSRSGSRTWQLKELFNKLTGGQGQGIWSRNNYVALLQYSFLPTVSKDLCFPPPPVQSLLPEERDSRGSTPSNRRGSTASSTTDTRSETPQTESDVVSLVQEVSLVCKSLGFKEEEKFAILVLIFGVNNNSFISNNNLYRKHQRLSHQQLLIRVLFDYGNVDLEKCNLSTSSGLPLQVRHLIVSLLTAILGKTGVQADSEDTNNPSIRLKDIIRRIIEASPSEEILSLGNSPFDLSSFSSLDKNSNLLKTGLAIEDIVDSRMSTNTSSANNGSKNNMTDEQITAMLVNESGGGVLTSEMLKPFEVTPRLCAHLLFAMCRGPQTKGVTSNEDIDSLANMCREFLPSASPLADIIRAIDSETFVPLNERVVNLKSAGRGFSRFLHFCLSLCNTDKAGVSLLGSLFFTQLWSLNVEFQFGFVVSCVRLNVVPKLLSSSTESGNSLGQLLPQIESLKCQPDFEAVPEMGNWRYQRLFQILLDAVNSQSNPMTSPPCSSGLFFPVVIELLKTVLITAPDFMALGILACSGPVTQVRKDLLAHTIPYFLGNHPNAAVILHLLWNQGGGGGDGLVSLTSTTNTQQSNWSKAVLLQSMCDHYMKSPLDEQQSRLSRILDVAQDLKALSLLLNSSCYPFVIDLACLASRREYLKLDKWLLDKINSNGEPFVQATISFLSKRCPALLAGSKALESGGPAVTNLPGDNLATLLACLHHTIGGGNGGSNTNISKHANDEILTMVSNSSLLLHNRSVPSLASMASTSSISSTSSIPSSLLQSKLSSSSLPQQPPPGQTRSGAAPVGIVAPTISHNNSDINSLASMAGNLSLGQSRTPFAMPPTAAQQQHQQMAGQQAQQGQQQAGDVWKDLARVFPEMQQTVSPEIEKEADTYFQRIYNHTGPQSMAIDEVLEMLRRFQDSSVPREREIFTCMIRNLFKEYGYFPQYPDKELLITAQLFGGIIQMGLVKYMALVLALRYVLEALRKPHRSKMYFFGIAALDRFKTKLKDYPLYCQHLTGIPHFEEFPPVLIEYVRHGAQSNEPPSRSPSTSVPAADPGSILPPASSAAPAAPSNVPVSIVRPSAVGSGSTTKPSIAAADIATLLAAGESVAHIQTPPEPVQDKVAFIINNLSQMNLQQKTEEFKEVICKDGDVFYSWIAQYFVMKRASIELNFHNLYANFLEVLKIEQINQLIIRETFRNIKVLLRSNKEAENFSDRSLLKNLGHWLGILTLAKSRPILSIDLDVKKLLIEAYHKGPLELLWVVPFIAKILESTAKSRIFRPPNPWTMGIIRALVELHQEPSLKLNLKFEVEVLCKALTLDMNSVANACHDRCVLIREDLRLRVLAEPQLGSKVTAPQLPSVGNNRDGLDTAFQGTPAGSYAGDSSESLVPKNRQQQLHHDSGVRVNASPPGVPVIPSPGVHVFNYHDISVNNVSSLAQLVVIPANVALFHQQPALKQLVRVGIERAIAEWVTPVIERSMKIAIITAEKMIRKDFALEPDELVVCRAAHSLIRSLTAGMSMITAKEPLFISIVGNLTQNFARAATNASKEMIDTAAQAAAAENIDLACCFVQKSSVEKASMELEKRLAPDYEARRKARIEGRRFCDTNALNFQIERMPEQIRLHVGSTPPHHFQVYEEIGRNVPGFNVPIIEPPNSSMSQALQHHQQQREVAAAQAVQQQRAQQFDQQAQQHQAQSNQQLPVDASIIVLYDKLVAELDSLSQQLSHHNQPHQLVATMQQILETVSIARTNPRDIVGAMSLIQRVLDAIQELLQTVEANMPTNSTDPSAHQIHMALTTKARDLYLVILKALADPRAYGQQWTTKQITRSVLDRLLTQQQHNNSPLPDDQFEILMKSGLINLSLLDAHLAQFLDQSPVALALTFQFLKIYGPQGLHESDITHVIIALIKLSKSNNTPSLTLEIEQILNIFNRNGSSSIPVGQVTQELISSSGVNVEQSENDFQEKTERLLREWIQMYYSPQHDINKFFHAYVGQMNHHGILKTDDSITRFFQHSTELCVDYCFRHLTHTNSNSPTAVLEIRSKCFHTLDAFAHLILMLVKHSGSNAGTQLESSPKISLLNKVLGIIANVAIADQEARGENFQHLPYYRILIILFVELTLGCHNLGLPLHQMSGSIPNIDPLVETIQFQVLTAFCQTLRAIRPSKVPSFAYAWLDFISHRTFLDKCLNGVVAGSAKGWPLFANLLMELIKFLSPFLRCVEMSTPVELLYKGTLKLLLVLLHDFPEFLCEFCFDFCDVIPSNSIQMRNLILSAFPRSMRLPDPFTPNLKIEQLPEINLIPKGIRSSLANLANAPFKKDLDSYLRTRSPVTFLSELRGHLQLSSSSASGDMTVAVASTGSRYNIPLMNALVLYVGEVAIQSINPRHINMGAISHSSHMDIFQNLAVDLDSEGRYLFLNAITNQLRFPNAFTHYFSCSLLYLFAESNTQAIQEQITRVLLERLIVNRPHPWGLLVTFIELIKNPNFKFWSHDFVRCAPEIEKLFESVAKSCGSMKSGPQEITNQSIGQPIQ